MATAGGLALAGAGAAAEATLLLVLLNAAIDVVQIHDSETPRSRSTSPAVRSFNSASMVALTRFVGLVLPKLLVRMSRMPEASQTARYGRPGDHAGTGGQRARARRGRRQSGP